MNSYFAQRKFWAVAIAIGLIVLLMIGLGLLGENTATALTEAQANATRDQATWLAIAEYAPDKATQEAILELTRAVLPTVTPFNKMATVAAMDKWLTTSPTPESTEAPMSFIQRPAGAGRLIGAFREICGEHNLRCLSLNAWVEKVKDKFVFVYAGRQFNDVTNSLEALVIVDWWSLDGSKLLEGGGVFPAPIPARAVMIVDAIGEQLTLRTDDGKLLVFDVPSQQYISVPQSQLIARSQRQVEGGTILENGDVPLTLPEFRVTNRWSGKNPQGRITVFAGGSNNDFGPGKGMLAIVISKGEPTAADTPQIYSLPDTYTYDTGVLWVFDVKGNLITLASWEGNEFFFDLAKRQFVREGDAWPKLFTAPLFDPNMPVSNATPEPVTPFIPPTPVSTPVPSAYP